MYLVSVASLVHQTTRKLRKHSVRIASGLLIVVALLGFLVSWRWGWAIVSQSSTGLDVTDEGYYLSAVEFPNRIPHAPTDYGVYLRNIWLLTGRSISLFRISGFILLFISSYMFSYLVTEVLKLQTSRARWTVRFAICFVVLAVSSYQYILWIPTPNYNLLTLVFLLPLVGLIINIYAIETDPNSADESKFLFTHHFWVGLGAVLLFAVRFSAAAGVVMVYAVVLVVSKEMGGIKTRSICFAKGVVAGAIVHLALARRWPWTSGSLWKRSLQLSRLRDDHPSSVIWEMDFFKSDVRPWLGWGAGTLVVVILLRIVVRNADVRRLFSFVMALTVVVSMWNSKPHGGSSAAQLGVGWWWLRLFFYAALAVFLVSDRPSSLDAVGPSVMFLGVLGALGSANGVYRQTIFMLGIFAAGLVSQVVVYVRRAERNTLITTPASVVMSLVLVLVFSGVNDATADPYRLQGPLPANNVPVQVGDMGTLMVHPDTAEFVRWIQSSKQELPPDVRCVVNLEGGTPVIPVVLGIPPAGSNWQLGGYPGSSRAEATGLEAENCWKDGPFVLVSSSNSFRAIAIPQVIRELCVRPPFSERDVRISYPARISLTLCNG